MFTRITGEEFGRELDNYRVSAFRLEQQPAYRSAAEDAHVEAFLAGDPIPPQTLDGMPEWLAGVRRNTAAGRTMTRVRIHDVPPTGYQRWVRSMDEQCNTPAGEVIHYVPRPDALVAGITPDLGDWWLLDSNRVLTLNFDATGALIELTLTDDPDRIAEALRWQARALELAAHDKV